MIDAILYRAGNGYEWRVLPAGFPPRRTVYGLHVRRKADRVMEDIAGRLRAAVRVAAGREPGYPRGPRIPVGGRAAAGRRVAPMARSSIPSR